MFAILFRERGAPSARLAFNAQRALVDCDTPECQVRAIGWAHHPVGHQLAFHAERLSRVGRVSKGLGLERPGAWSPHRAGATLALGWSGKRQRREDRTGNDEAAN